MLEILKQPWHWAISGALIALIMFTLFFFGGTFGFSRNLRTICSAIGIGKGIKYFDFDWKEQKWNLAFLVGSIVGGFIAHQFLSTDEPIKISLHTIHDLSKLGFAAPTEAEPPELYSIDALMSLKGFLLLAIGGLLVGFGTRYAEGCTSGHAITGLSNLQIPSLIAVIGFFIGGLVMTYLIFPLIF